MRREHYPKFLISQQPKKREKKDYEISCRQRGGMGSNVRMIALLK